MKSISPGQKRFAEIFNLEGLQNRMDLPRLTIVLPAHNAELTIAAAIQSMLSQSYPNFELWILESGSSDRTAEVARAFTDPRVKVFELGSMSFQNVLGFALNNAQTEWLARMDSDDLSFPDRLRKQVEVIAAQPDLVLVGTRFVYLTPFGHIVETRPGAVSRDIGPLNLRLLGNDARFFADASVVYRRSVALEVGGYDPEFPMSDVPLWFRMLSVGKGFEIAQPLYLYRLHPNSMRYTNVAPSDELYRFLVKYAPDLLHLHFPEGAFQPKPVSWHLQYYWLTVAIYEILAGDREAVLQAVHSLDREGPVGREARLIRWFNLLGPLGTTFYRWYGRNKYRHRPDWERLFSDRYGSLVIDTRAFPARDSNA